MRLLQICYPVPGLCIQTVSSISIEALLHICLQSNWNIFTLLLPITKPLCPEFPDYVLIWGTVCVKLLRVWKEATFCHSNPQKHEEFCLAGTIVLQEVVTYTSCVEVFAIGIKIESSDQVTFGANQGDLWTPKINGSRTHSCNLTLDPLKIKRSRASEGNDQAIKHTFCRSKTLIPAANTRIGGM